MYAPPPPNSLLLVQVVTLKTFPSKVEAPSSRSPPAPEPPLPPTHPAADEVDDEDHPLLVNPRLAERNRCRSGEDENNPPSVRSPEGGGSPVSAPPSPLSVPPPSMGGVCVDGSTGLLPASARRCCLLPEDAARCGGESDFLPPARAAAQRTRRLPPGRSKLANGVRPRKVRFLSEILKRTEGDILDRSNLCHPVGDVRDGSLLFSVHIVATRRDWRLYQSVVRCHISAPCSSRRAFAYCSCHRCLPWLF